MGEIENSRQLPALPEIIKNPFSRNAVLAASKPLPFVLDVQRVFLILCRCGGMVDAADSKSVAL
ncbi:MAG: hypothetical protein JWM59_1533 [Verrucomicrobiales bacterium]|nr:hypothetical protein [Verrucomicrobiales bacterium]